METAPEQTEPARDLPLAIPEYDELELGVGAPSKVIDVGAHRRGPREWARERWSAVAQRELLWITVTYLAVRGLLLLVAYVESSVGHYNFLHELANWDGLWYRELANHGYPHHVSYAQTTLGFFPLFPLAIWLVEQPLLLLTVHNAIWCSTVAGALISAVGGLIATVLIHRLAKGWWNSQVARRATILFIVFPGSVVFSMVYSEGLLLPLSAGCIYMLQQRRWIAAGLLAGVGSAVQPVGLVLPVVCAVSAAAELHRRGWRPRLARRSLMAPLLSVTGVGGFAIFLWIWTGSPLANYIAQHHGWSEKSDPAAVVHMATRLGSEISLSHFDQPTINLNYVVGLIGVVFLVVMLILTWFSRREISLQALVWTAAISLLALTSENVPPNPRMLFTAFPALLVVARYVQGRWFRVIVWANCGLLIGLSVLTLHGTTLRP